MTFRSVQAYTHTHRRTREKDDVKRYIESNRDRDKQTNKNK